MAERGQTELEPAAELGQTEQGPAVAQVGAAELGTVVELGPAVAQVGTAELGRVELGTVVELGPAEQGQAGPEQGPRLVSREGPPHPSHPGRHQIYSQLLLP